MANGKRFSAILFLLTAVFVCGTATLPGMARADGKPIKPIVGPPIIIPDKHK